MKILAFADLHADIRAYKKIKLKIGKFKPEVVFCMGDFTIFEQNIQEIMHMMNELGRPVILIHGNHESENVVKRICRKYSNLAFGHKAIIKTGEYTVVAHGGGGFYGRGRFAKDRDFDEFVKKNKSKIKGNLILITHAPPLATKLDFVDWLGEHVGCQSYTDFINKYKPLLALSGHIHESFNQSQRLNNTLVCNPGPEGAVFNLTKKRAIKVR